MPIPRGRPSIGVDFDGSLVERDVSPPRWRPMAKEFLIAATDAGVRIVLHSCRSSMRPELDPPWAADDFWRGGTATDEARQTWFEQEEMRRFLEAEQIWNRVEVWTAPGKPLVDRFIDDRSEAANFQQAASELGLPLMDDEAVVRQMQQEAAAAGATLANGGRGGLDPRLALAVFRRDGWRCSNTACPTPRTNITLDHISGHAQEIREDAHDPAQFATLERGIELGHVNELDALHTLCAACHTQDPVQSVHAREEQIEAGEKPAPMRGEEG